MATIEWQKVPSRKGDEGQQEERIFPRMKNSTVVNLDQICKKVATHSAFNSAELQAAFIKVVIGIQEQLAEGKTVDISDLGTFRLALGTEGSVTTSTPHPMKQICVEGINFHPSRQMMKGIGTPNFMIGPDSARQRFSVEELIEPLTSHLQLQGSITCKGFQQLFDLPRSTATLRLRQLVERGVLKVEGVNRSRIYKLG